MGQAEQETNEEVVEGQTKSRRREVWNPARRRRTLAPGRRHLTKPSRVVCSSSHSVSSSLLYSGCSFSAQSSEARPLLANSILSLLLDQMEKREQNTLHEVASLVRVKPRKLSVRGHVSPSTAHRCHFTSSYLHVIHANEEYVHPLLDSALQQSQFNPALWRLQWTRRGHFLRARQLGMRFVNGKL